MVYRISKPDRSIKGRIALDGSKSISNRVLIIRALSGKDFPIDRLSTSKDTTTMLRLLQNGEEIYDAGAAGTTFRFLTAFLSLQPGTQVLTGSDRMKQRPIGSLVEALRHLGAHIDYIEKEGYPPLRIHSPENIGANNNLSIPANISSQFISALLMIAPYLRNGLHLRLEGNIVSRPYIEMTLQIMERFGVKAKWKENVIHISPQVYQSNEYTIESDWSASSYWYSVAALSKQANILLKGLC